MQTLPGLNHDHEHCIASVLADAERLCRDQKIRLTAQRHRVLEIVAESHEAMGAFIEEVYNRQRLHSALAYQSPSEFEASPPVPWAAVQQPRVPATMNCP